MLCSRFGAAGTDYDDEDANRLKPCRSYPLSFTHPLWPVPRSCDDDDEFDDDDDGEKTDNNDKQAG